MSDAKWIVSPVPEKETIEEIALNNNVSRLISAILCVRGFNSLKASEFLNTEPENLPDPFLLKGMKEAVARIKKAIQNKEKITVFGDYDVDGVTATTLMLCCLKELGADVSFYIPSREKEGYGITNEAIEQIASNGTKLIVNLCRSENR